MGAHPIFESDFDCLTESRSKMHIRFNEQIVNVETTDELLNMVPSGEVLNRPIRAGMTLEQAGILENMSLSTQPGLLGGKVHGSLARAGKVKGQTPKVDAEEKKKAHRPCQETNAIQPSIRECCSIIRQEEGTKFKLII